MQLDSVLPVLQAQNIGTFILLALSAAWTCATLIASLTFSHLHPGLEGGSVCVCCHMCPPSPLHSLSLLMFFPKCWRQINKEIQGMD